MQSVKESGKYVEGEGVGGGEFDDVQPRGKDWRGREFVAFFEFKISDLVHTLGEFVK